MCDSSDIRGVTTKVLYKLLMESFDYTPKIIEKNPDVEFTPVFKNVFDKFMDRFSRDVIFKIVHGILPINNLLFNHNVYKSNRCTFCAREPETLRHLFCDCVPIKLLFALIKNWIFSLSNGMLLLDFEHILYRNIIVTGKKLKNVILLLIGLYCKTIWIVRNWKKFDRKHVLPNDIYVFFLQQLRLRILADFERLPLEKFIEYWCMSDLFCKVEDEELVITFF